jgi:hypothetical protein
MLCSCYLEIKQDLDSDLDLDPYWDLDSNTDPKLHCGSGSEHANNFGFSLVRMHNLDS